MELDIVHVPFQADVYDVRRAVALVLHGPYLYDPNDKSNGRVPNLQVVMGTSPIGLHHNNTAILCVTKAVGRRLLRWYQESDNNRIVIHGEALMIVNNHRKVTQDVKKMLENEIYVDQDLERPRNQIEDLAMLVRLRATQIQAGVWYKSSNSLDQRRRFSVELDLLHHDTAYISVVDRHKHIQIVIRQRETGINYFILVKFSNIRKLHLDDEDGGPFIIFELYTPPNFEQESSNNRAPEGFERKSKYKTRDRICALDDAHARISPYAHHLRVRLAEPDDIKQFEKILILTECQHRLIRVPRVDAQPMQFFSQPKLNHLQGWFRTMDFKVAFQIEGYLRCGLLNTQDLLTTLRDPIEKVIDEYGDQASELLRLFSMELQMHQDETSSDCLARVRSEHYDVEQLKLRLPVGTFSCHHVIIAPSRIFLEGPYPTQSNRVIRRYQSRDPTLAERFIRVEFRDEDHMAYRWGGEVDGTWFLHKRVGGILRKGFELGGRVFEYLGYSMSGLRDQSVWFVSPFRDPVEGYVTAETIRSSLGDFSRLLRTPSKYAARMAQAFTPTYPGIMVRRGEWEEQPDLGPHTDGVGTISSELSDKIWAQRCRDAPGLRNNRVQPSAYQFRFLGYKGVVVVDRQLKGIKMRLRGSQRKFPVHNVEEAEFEIVRSFDYPNPVHLNRPAVMILDNRGVSTSAFLELQGTATRDIHSASRSLDKFKKLLATHNLGGKFHLVSILDQLSKLGLDIINEDGNNNKTARSTFFGRLLPYAMNHSLREVKFKARIPVPESYQLVGVADEGQAYINEGKENVYTLKEGHIYVCVQESPNDSPIYLKGLCLISRSPAIHPGDVQRVYAIGEPPTNQLCSFRDLKNVVVLPAVGDRSLASCLSGGDLDGDTYDIYYANPQLCPLVIAEPARYEAGAVWTLEEGRSDATVDDICDFIVEYINSDVMGLLADRHIVIADQSQDGVFDWRCMKLAELCSRAVDYAANGEPVDIYNNLPRPLIKSKPDWHKVEVTGAREPDYYHSDRALGHLFRNISLLDPDEPIKRFPIISAGSIAPMEDVISCALAPLVQRILNLTPKAPGAENSQAEELHTHFAYEMRYICITHTLVDAPDVRLTEEEVVLGTILATCTQTRWRSDRTFRMKLHAEGLLHNIRTWVIPVKVSDEGQRTDSGEDYRAGLLTAWAIWGWAQHHRDKEFIESFSLVMLGIVLDCLKELGGLPEV